MRALGDVFPQLPITAAALYPAACHLLDAAAFLSTVELADALHIPETYAEALIERYYRDYPDAWAREQARRQTRSRERCAE